MVIARVARFRVGLGLALFIMLLLIPPLDGP